MILRDLLPFDIMKEKTGETAMIRIVNLMEDTCGNDGCLYEHGFLFTWKRRT